MTGMVKEAPKTILVAKKRAVDYANDGNIYMIKFKAPEFPLREAVPLTLINKSEVYAICSRNRLVQEKLWTETG
jgi:hypothetical protein